MGTTSFSLEIKTQELTRAAKRLCKVEKRANDLHLSYSEGVLSLSLGATQEDVPARGSWPSPVRVVRGWAEKLSTFTNEVVVINLRVSEEKIWARDFGVSCSFGDHADAENKEDMARRQGDIAAAVRGLSHYHVTTQEMETLMDEADPEKAGIWSPGDDRVVKDIVDAWEHLYTYGVEPSDIRRLLHRKSRDLWKNSATPR
jgi:hypothetical protein